MLIFTRLGMILAIYYQQTYPHGLFQTIILMKDGQMLIWLKSLLGISNKNNNGYIVDVGDVELDEYGNPVYNVFIHKSGSDTVKRSFKTREEAKQFAQKMINTPPS